jgi:hypothetical protein
MIYDEQQQTITHKRTGTSVDNGFDFTGSEPAFPPLPSSSAILRIIVCLSCSGL